MGTTAIKTDRVVRRALDEVLAIDEAYAWPARRPGWISGGGDRDAPEADGGLSRAPRRDRGQLSDAMRRFPGARIQASARVSREIVFPDYSTADLVAIHPGGSRRSRVPARRRGGRWAHAPLQQSRRGPGFGNARFARTVFEQALNSHALRLAGQDDLGDVDAGACCRRSRRGTWPPPRKRFAPTDPRATGLLPPRAALLVPEVVWEPS